MSDEQDRSTPEPVQSAETSDSEASAASAHVEKEEEPMSKLKGAIVKIIILGAPIVVEELWRWMKKRRARKT